MEKIKSNWKKIAIVLVILLAILVVKQLNSGSAKKQITYAIKRQNLEEVLSLSGHVDASEHAILQFQTGGQLAWVGVKEGDTVKKYQVLASLDQQALKKDLQKSLNTYVKYRNTYDQNKDTYKDQAITDSIRRIVDNGGQDLGNSVIDVELQDLAIKYANLWTPIDGVVTRIDTKVPGVNIALPSQAQIEIVNPSTLYFSSVVDQTDVVNMTPGMKGTISLDAFPNSSIPGEISEIGFTPKVGEAGTVYEVKILFNPTDLSRVRFGMTGDMSFTLAEKKGAISLPKNLVKDDNGKKFTYVLVNGKTDKRAISIGEEIDNQIVITSGLLEKDLVVDKP